MRLVIVDYMNFVYNTFFTPFVKNSSKDKIQGAFLYMLLNKYGSIIKKASKNTENFIIIFAQDRKSIKKKYNVDYKSNRNRHEKFELILDTSNIFLKIAPNIIAYANGAEADDVINSITKKFYKKVEEIHILSTDTDLLQLKTLNENIRQFNLKYEEFDEKYIEKKFKIKDFSKLLYFKIFYGDSTDNIISPFKKINKKAKRKVREIIENEDNLITIIKNIADLYSFSSEEYEAFYNNAIQNLYLVKLRDLKNIKLKIHKPEKEIYEKITKDFQIKNKPDFDLLFNAINKYNEVFKNATQ